MESSQINKTVVQYGKPVNQRSVVPFHSYKLIYISLSGLQGPELLIYGSKLWFVDQTMDR